MKTNRNIPVYLTSEDFGMPSEAVKKAIVPNWMSSSFLYYTFMLFEKHCMVDFELSDECSKRLVVYNAWFLLENKLSTEQVLSLIEEYDFEQIDSYYEQWFSMACSESERD